MNAATTYIAIILSVVASTWCWWRIWRSEDSLVFKVIFAVIASIPLLGPFLYLFADMPPRNVAARRAKHQQVKAPSAFLRRWNEREHVYLGWASVVFWGLAVVAYWMNNWSPGRIIEGRFGTYTEVDVLFFALLVGAVLTFGAALRAKILMVRMMREASNDAFHSTPSSLRSLGARERGR